MKRPPQTYAYDHWCLVARLFNQRDKHQHCFYCGVPTRQQSDRTKDHIFPQVLGGKVCVNSCLPCNRAKGSMLPEEFRASRFNNKPIEFFGETILRPKVDKETFDAVLARLIQTKPHRVYTDSLYR